MSPLAEFAIGSATGFALVVSRLSGFVVTSPFPGNHVGATARIGLVVALSWVATPFAGVGPAGATLDARLLPTAIADLSIGVLIGLVFRILMSAADVAGGMIAQGTGLAGATIFDPASGEQNPAIARVVTLGALLLAVGLGVHRMAIGLLLESFRAIPVGTPVAPGAAAPLLLDLAGQALSVGVRLSMPIVAISLIIQVALAMIARSAPSLQIFSVGFSILIASGLLVLGRTLPDFARALAEDLSRLPAACEAVLGRIVVAH